MNKKNFYVANYRGELAGHDLTEAQAIAIASILLEEEPNEEWEAICCE